MQESSGKFASYFKRLLQQEMTAGDAGVGSTNAANEPKQGDFIAKDDARKPNALPGGVQTRSGSVSKKNKDKKKRGIDELFLTGEEEKEKDTPTKRVQKSNG